MNKIAVLFLKEWTNSTVFTRIDKFYNLFGPEKSRDIAFFPSTVTRVHRWWISRVRSLVAHTYREFHSHGQHLRKQISWTKESVYIRKGFNSHVAAVLLFWDTNMAYVTCQNVLYLNLVTVHQYDAQSECNSTNSFCTMENSRYYVVFNVWSEEFWWRDNAWSP